MIEGPKVSRKQKVFFPLGGFNIFENADLEFGIDEFSEGYSIPC